ncbi:MAG: hypothetical protein JWN84_1649 [Nocardioides sp.]|nr:hypothetical protein [Nocardioides sp.]
MSDNSFGSYLAAAEATATPERRAQMEGARDHADVLYREHFGLGEQLVALRKAHHLTQGELAAATGVGQSEISRIEQGKANPTMDTLARLGSSLGATVAFATEDGKLVTP